jgi:outer membrane protein assembly factor BamD
MNRRYSSLLLVLVGLVALPHISPAPLIYRPGEGWTYESPDQAAQWRRDRAQEQLAVAEEAIEREDYRQAMKAARRVVTVWPLSDYAPQAQFVVARSREELGQDEKAFKAYQTALEQYPRVDNYDEILQRQYEICNRFLDGQWFKLWGLIPFFPSMDKTAEMYAQIVKSGPQSEVAPKAQISIGTAREKQSKYPEAVKAYERAADVYYDQKEIAAEATYKAGLAYQKLARKAEYDQSTAAKAIATLTDFITLFPDDPRTDEAQEIIDSLKTEQARGSFETARYYEKKDKYRAAVIYYNDSVLKDPNSPHAEEARERIARLKPEIESIAQ